MIKFVYFDVGGVAVKDFSSTTKWKELQIQLGVTPINENKFQEIWAKYKKKICIDYDLDDMVEELNAYVGLTIPKNHSFLQGFVDRFEKNQSIWPIIDKVKKTKKVGLLTNMYVGMLDAIGKRRLLPPVQWDVVMDSSIVKLQKPDRMFFELAQKSTNFSGNEILFVDNLEKHVKAAQEYGWQTYLYDSSDYENASATLNEFLNHVRVC